MKAFLPTLIGLLVLGIAFNSVLCVFGILGLHLWDALYLTTLALTVLLSLGVHCHIQRTGRRAG